MACTNRKRRFVWWRDQDFDPPYKEPNGKNWPLESCNGWVYAALVRVLMKFLLMKKTSRRLYSMTS